MLYVCGITPFYFSSVNFDVNLVFELKRFCNLSSMFVIRREILQETAPHLVNSVCAYRAGYIAEVSFFFLLTIINGDIDELYHMKIMK